MTSGSTYPDQARACAEHLYHVWHGYYMLVEMTVNVLNEPNGWRDVRPLTFDEALTIRLTPRQAMRLVAPGWVWWPNLKFYAHILTLLNTGV
jgi:hypothetical protein